eukprot:TRINITY_DN7385_c0_g1_i1.p1 TRINITY_DN7385_c0_g1~~TRINITY_DN7385_c0_g1_i1.p1  ORF type:complete len:245 (+),score=67.92 TRINITY_DN7385_c0_g1_i1:154-888(+)
MPTLDGCLQSSQDFEALKALMHPKVRAACGKPNVFEGGVRTYTRVTPGTGLHMLLGEFQIDGVSVQLFKSSLCFTERVKWDDLFIGGRDITAYRIKEDPDLDIFHRAMYFKSPAPLLINPRDFEVLISEKFEKDGSFICKCISVTPPRQPAVPGSVRGEILTTGFIAQAHKGNSVRVFYVAQIDPKGWIPASVVNLIISRQAKSIQNLKKHVLSKHRSGSVVPPRMNRDVQYIKIRSKPGRSKL